MLPNHTYIEPGMHTVFECSRPIGWPGLLHMTDPVVVFLFRALRHTGTDPMASSLCTFKKQCSRFAT